MEKPIYPSDCLSVFSGRLTEGFFAGLSLALVGRWETEEVAVV